MIYIALIAIVIGTIKAWLVLSTFNRRLLFKYIKLFDVFSTVFLSGLAFSAGITMFMMTVVSSAWMCMIIHIAKSLYEEE